MLSVLFNIAIAWVLRRTVKDPVKRHKMDPFFYTQGPRFRRRFSPIVQHFTADPGKDRPAQHIQQPGWLAGADPGFRRGASMASSPG